jgi:hypothetical protein
MSLRARAAVAVVLVAAIASFPMVVLAATFSDVPTSHPFYNDIEALAASGVTSGCGGGKFCPGDFVTRGQMAAFMNRLGALQAGKAPVVNAAKLSGVPASGFARFGVTLPPSALLTGTFAFADSAEPGTDALGVDDIQFTWPLASAPIVHLIHSGNPVPAGCSGSEAAPNASAGHLCIFASYTSEADALDGFYSATTGFDGQSSARGVVVYLFDATGDGVVEGTGTWAVRAPTGSSFAEPPATEGVKGAQHP